MCEVSVIMATYKEELDLLKEAIESILNQTYTDFEFIIILDNPNNNRHIQCIKDYEKKDKRIKFYVNEKNMGLTNTLNRGLGLAKGKYICRMDADDVSISNRLEIQKKHLERNDYDLIGGVSQMIDENGKPIYSIKKVPTNEEKIKKSLKYNQIISHPTWFGKKELFDKMNGYRMMPLCEDYDFTLRAVLAGYRISNINETVLKYRMTSTSISRSNLFEQYLYAKYITKKYGNGEIADIDKAKQYVKEKNNPKKARRYLKANVRFNNALRDIEEKKYFKFFIDGILLTFTSLNYLDKIYRFVKVSSYS